MIRNYIFFVSLAMASLHLVGSDSSEQKCYSCTTPDAEATLRGVQDKDWQRWLNSVRSVPRSPACSDPYDSNVAVRSGALLEDCEKGVCMKMWFQERSGKVQIWRTCIPNAKGVVRTDCTKITSSEGDMEVCTCDGHACNSAPSYQRGCIWANYLIPLVITASLLLYAYQLSLFDWSGWSIFLCALLFVELIISKIFSKNFLIPSVNLIQIKKISKSIIHRHPIHHRDPQQINHLHHRYLHHYRP